MAEVSKAEPIQQTKVCPKCGEEKNRSEFNKNNAKKDGLFIWCRQCQSNYRKIYHRRKHALQKVEILPAGKKKCNKCGEVKDISEFHRDKTKNDGLRTTCKSCKDASDKKYRSEHKNELREYFKDYAQKNKKRIQKYKKIYAEKNKGKILSQWREYYEKKKDDILEYQMEYRSKNKERIQEYKKEYADKHKDKLREYKKKYAQKYKHKIRRYKKEYQEKNREKLRNSYKESRRSSVLYETYAHQLTVDESPIADGSGYLLVKCTYCGRYYYPTRGEINPRLKTLKGQSVGEMRLYCSDTCKQACPVYNVKEWPRGYKPASSREVQPELRQMRLALDDYECQKCGVSIDVAELHCHHYTGTMQNPVESADVDNTITVCNKCHKWVHTQEGCRYFELRCGKNNGKIAEPGA